MHDQTIVRVFLASKKYADGTSPVRIEFYSKDNTRHTKTLFRINPNNWKDGKVVKHPNSIKLNLLINEELNKANEYLLDCHRLKIPVDPKVYFNSKSINLLSDLLFNEAKDRSEAGSHRTAEKFTVTANKVLKFNPKTTVFINADWIDKFAIYWAKEGNRPNTIAKDLKNIKVVINKAIRRGLLAVNPFAGYKIKTEETVKEKLSIEEIRLLQNADLSNSDKMIVEVFLFALFHWGMRASDVITLKKSNIVDGRIIYTTHKSNKRHEIDQVFYPTEYPGEYVFPFLGKFDLTGKYWLKKVNSANSLINKRLKAIAKRLGINKTVTMHIARHSFAAIADEKGLSLNDIRELLGHSNIKTTAIYLKSIQNSDELNRKVKGLFN